MAGAALLTGKNGAGVDAELGRKGGHLLGFLLGNPLVGDGSKRAAHHAKLGRPGRGRGEPQRSFVLACLSLYRQGCAASSRGRSSRGADCAACDDAGTGKRAHRGAQGRTVARVRRRKMHSPAPRPFIFQRRSGDERAGQHKRCCRRGGGGMRRGTVQGGERKWKRG